MAFLCFGLLNSWASPVVLAQPDRPIEISARMGLGGHWKVGYSTWTQVRLKSPQAFDGYCRLQTVDGDGVPVSYGNWSVHVEAGIETSLELYAQHGRAGESIEVLLYDSRDQLISRKSLTPEERGQAMTATQPWIVTIGGDLELQQAALRTGTGLTSFTSSVISVAYDLPRSEMGYAGVSLLAISTSNLDWFQEMLPEQKQALQAWIVNGGRVLVSMGSNGGRLAPDSWLRDLLPGKILGVVEGVEPGPLESWVNSSIPLAPLTCLRIDAKGALTDLSAMTPSREAFPLVTRRAMGFGQVLLFATDLDSPNLKTWTDRRALIEKLIGKQWRAPDKSKTYTMGFNDLTGQLRSMLDNFGNVQSASLTNLAFVMVALLLFLGPIDYFVFNVWLKRPKWTWITLIAISMISCGIMISYRDRWKPAQLQVNALEVLDIDEEQGLVHGTSWLHLYAGHQGLYQIQHRVLPTGNLRYVPTDVQLDWMGLPGSGLGGFESAVSADRGMPEYQVLHQGTPQAEMVNVGIQTASTKSFQTRWSGRLEQESKQSLQVNEGADLLNGSWENRLGVDLLDASLMYRNWQYPMPSRVVAGQRLEFSTLSEPKDLARRLQLRQVVEGSERGVPWDPENRTQLGRLAEMLLFYGAAGGESYVHLEHRYLNQMDYSELLRMDRAIIMGRIQSPLQSLQVVSDKGAEEVLEGNRQSWIRIVVPVNVMERTKSR